MDRKEDVHQLIRIIMKDSHDYNTAIESFRRTLYSMHVTLATALFRSGYELCDAAMVITGLNPMMAEGIPGIEYLDAATQERILAEEILDGLRRNFESQTAQVLLSMLKISHSQVYCLYKVQLPAGFYRVIRIGATYFVLHTPTTGDTEYLHYFISMHEAKACIQHTEFKFASNPKHTLSRLN